MRSKRILSFFIGIVMLGALQASVVSVFAQVPALDSERGVMTMAPLLEKVTPAVVNISVRTRMPANDNPLLRDPFFRRFFDVPKGLPKREAMSAGSGVIVDADKGYVLTNHHVIDGCTTIRVSTEGRKHLLSVVGTDAKNDLAVLTLPAPVSDVARFRAGRTIRPGDGVVVVGFPLHGLLASEANVTTGTVSALAGIGNDTRFLQITAPVQFGNSGGPLLDAGGCTSPK